MNAPAVALFGVAVTVAVAYAATAYAATRFAHRLCRTIERFADGPPPRTPQPAFFVCAAALVGAVLALHHAGALQTIATGVLAAALAAGCYCDMQCGIVPDECTVAPLGAVLALSLYARDATPLLASTLVVVPFALVALVSNGRGLGWGDVKLAALVAAVLGFEMTVAAFGAACFVAAASALLRRRRHEPIAFAPYLAGSATLALLLPVAVR